LVVFILKSRKNKNNNNTVIVAPMVVDSSVFHSRKKQTNKKKTRRAALPFALRTLYRRRSLVSDAACVDATRSLRNTAESMTQHRDCSL